MFYINDRFHSKGDADQFEQQLMNLSWINSPENLRVAVCVENVEEWLFFCLFMKKAGGSVVPIHASMKEEGARKMAERTNSHVLIYHSWTEPVFMNRTNPEEEGVLIQMSSGTTGEPKVIARTWLSIDEELTNYVDIFPLVQSTPTIVACPITHSYGLLCGVFATMERGAMPIIVTSMNPKTIISAACKWDKSLIYAAPALVYMVAQLIKEPLFAVMISGTLMPTRWFEVVKRKVTHLLQQYGCSEAGCVTLHPAVSAPQSVGYPLPHVEIRAGTKDNPAEIVIVKRDQVIHTKDLGYVSDLGELMYVARLDDMINVAGMNVYPQEIEDILLEMEVVKEAIVYKKEDKWTGERVCVQLVASSEAKEEVKSWCQSKLLPYQIPVEWHFVASIPTLPNGKISRKQLGGLKDEASGTNGKTF